jgi:hypothetical protein
MIIEHMFLPIAPFEKTIVVEPSLKSYCEDYYLHIKKFTSNSINKIKALLTKDSEDNPIIKFGVNTSQGLYFDTAREKLLYVDSGPTIGITYTDFLSDYVQKTNTTFWEDSKVGYSFTCKESNQATLHQVVIASGYFKAYRT